MPQLSRYTTINLDRLRLIPMVAPESKIKISDRSEDSTSQERRTVYNSLEHGFLKVTLYKGFKSDVTQFCTKSLSYPLDTCRIANRMESRDFVIGIGR